MLTVLPTPVASTAALRTTSPPVTLPLGTVLGATATARARRQGDVVGEVDRAGYGEVTAAGRAHATGAADDVGDGVGVRAREHEVCVVGHRTGAQRTGGAAVTDLQRAAADGGRAAVGIGAGEDLRAGAGLDEIAGARDHAGEISAGAVVRAERQRFCRQGLPRLVASPVSDLTVPSVAEAANACRKVQARAYR